MVDADGVWTGDISIPAQMAEDIPLADVKVDGKVGLLQDGRCPWGSDLLRHPLR